MNISEGYISVQSLLSEIYVPLTLLTVGFITAGVNYTDTGKFSIFDCHAKDPYGKF